MITGKSAPCEASATKEKIRTLSSSIERLIDTTEQILILKTQANELLDSFNYPFMQLEPLKDSQGPQLKSTLIETSNKSFVEIIDNIVDFQNEIIDYTRSIVYEIKRKL